MGERLPDRDASQPAPTPRTRVTNGDEIGRHAGSHRILYPLRIGRRSTWGAAPACRGEWQMQPSIPERPPRCNRAVPASGAAHPVAAPPNGSTACLRPARPVRRSGRPRAVSRPRWPRAVDARAARRGGRRGPSRGRTRAPTRAATRAHRARRTRRRSIRTRARRWLMRWVGVVVPCRVEGSYARSSAPRQGRSCRMAHDFVTIPCGSRRAGVL